MITIMPQPRREKLPSVSFELRDRGRVRLADPFEHLPGRETLSQEQIHQGVTSEKHLQLFRPSIAERIREHARVAEEGTAASRDERRSEPIRRLAGEQVNDLPPRDLGIGGCRLQHGRSYVTSEPIEQTMPGPCEVSHRWISRRPRDVIPATSRSTERLNPEPTPLQEGIDVLPAIGVEVRRDAVIARINRENPVSHGHARLV